MIPSHNIIIIGSGISGLTIAAGLKNDNFLILEARDRIGGRVFTSSNNLDLGAAWLHGSENNPLNKYLDSNSLIPISNSNPWMHPENTPIKYLSNTYVIDSKVAELSGDHEAKCFESDMKSVVNQWRDIAAHIASMPNISISEALHTINFDYNDPLIFTFIYMMEVWCGGSIQNIPTSFLQSDEFHCALFGDYRGAHSLFKTGASTIVNTLVKTSYHNIHDRIKYNQIVTNVVYGAAGVEVYTRDGTKYTCEKLCITVPPGPLCDIHFTPPLDPTRKKALSQIKMGSYKKVQMVFDQSDVFWGAEPMVLTCDSKISGKDFYLGDGANTCVQCPYILWNNYMYSKNKPILEAVFPANNGWRLTGLTDEEIADIVMTNLRSCYPNVAEPKA
jgi:monoamine oxidase